MKVQLISVSDTATVKQFLTSKGLPYKKGVAYYQLTKKELIQDAKSILVRRKSDNQFLIGECIRGILGIPAETAAFTLNLSEIADFDVFVQSTSPVRKLLAGTQMVYDVGDGEGQTVLEFSGDIPAISEEMLVSAAAEEISMPSGFDIPIEVVVSFDTTGSMYPCLTQVRSHIRTMIRDLFYGIPDIRMAVIAQGDYGDVYETKHTGLSNNQDELCRFVETVSSTAGCDYEECYELVLREAHTKINWNPTARKVLIMIGDAIPHAANSHRNRDKIDWRKEAHELVRQGVNVYSVQALNSTGAANAFWKPLAHETGGIHLNLNQFSHAKDYIMAICYHNQSQMQLQTFRNQVQTEGRMNRSLHTMFATLMRDSTAFGGEDEGLEAVSPSRFQVLEVGPEKISIKQFALNNGLTFKVGRGFYEFTKPEVISDKKEVVLMSKRSGDMYTGDEACRLIGTGGSARVRPADLERWRVFVQSTSANRVLIPHTGFLYEVEYV